MKITNFEHTGLDRVSEWLGANHCLDESVLREVLKTVNVSFVLEGINRLQSTLVCELKDSYVQQSQRYVAMGPGSYNLPVLDAEDSKTAEQLTEQLFTLYSEMSQLKPGDFKGRPKTEQYVYGIPIEDARYILPLSTQTNVSVAMSADKLIDFYRLLCNPEYGATFFEVKMLLNEHLPTYLTIHLDNLGRNFEHNSKFASEFYKNDLAKISPENNMTLLSSFADLNLKVGLGALTSTLKESPSEKLLQWGPDATEKAIGVVNRVLGYGHESIAEQARTTFGMMCSMVTYHQQLRHRLPSNYRENLTRLVYDVDRAVVIPESIKKSPFCERFVGLVAQVKEFRKRIAEKYISSKALFFLLNCDQVKLITSTNARIDNGILAERICMNAQWEIRELSTKKLLLLRQLSKVLYEKALPSCFYGPCKEGKLTCGKQAEIKKKFN